MRKQIAFLGPKGTFTEEALHRYCKGQGWTIEAIPAHTIEEAIDMTMRDETEYAFVPVENSLGGTVLTTMDYLMEHRHIEICGEIAMPIRHYLWGIVGAQLKDITTVYSHPQAIRQCKPFLAEYLRHADTIYTGSTAEGGELVSTAALPNQAAIGGIALGHTYGLTQLSGEAQEHAYNLTRFILVRHNDHIKDDLEQVDLRKINGAKLSLLCELDGLRPGSLWEGLCIFAKRHINLVKIESRPTKGRLGEYKFFFDLQIESNAEDVKEALKELYTVATDVQLFGLYHTLIIE